MEQQCDKETATRLKWYSNNSSQESSSNEGGTVSRQSEVFRKRILAGCPKPAAWLQEVKDNYRPPPSFHHRTGAFEPTYPASSVNVDEDVLDMIPAESGTKNKLYVGISSENKGRYEYLRERSKLNPERKYHVPITSALEYGWALDEVIERKDIKKSEHGRSTLIQETFYRRTGIPTLHVPPTE